jgi:hypothetical protein
VLDWMLMANASALAQHLRGATISETRRPPMRVFIKTATMVASVLAIGLNIEPAQSLQPGPRSASPETAVQKVQQVQKLDREQAKALLRQRLAQRWEEMTPAERQRAKAIVRQRLGARWDQMTPAERLRATKRAVQIAARIQEKGSGYGYVDRERAKARVRQRLENAR